MNDTISRQWLMECVDEGWIKFDTEKDENRFIHLVRDMAPSAQPGWIPCDERLPGKDESFYVLCCDKYGEIMIGNVFECYDGETPYSAESEHEYMYDCVAWMPLPTPYREGGQDETD